MANVSTVGGRAGLRSVCIVAVMLLLAGCGAPAAAPVAPAATAAASQCVPVAEPATTSPNIHLRPASGGPGTAVCITGFIAGGPTATKATATQRRATACWDGCGNGLEETVDVVWSDSQAGAFATRVTVPDVPWLTASGPAPLRPGSYKLGLQCLLPIASGCVGQGSLASALGSRAFASFHLTGPAGGRCGPDQPCAELHLTPASGPPGTTVRVRGWAPVTSILEQPTGYSLLMEGRDLKPVALGQLSQARDGTVHGTFQIPASWASGPPLPPGAYQLILGTNFVSGVVTAPATAPGVTVKQDTGGTRVLLDAGTLTIAPSASWASLGSLKPLSIRGSASVYPGTITAAGSDLAYCIPAGIRLSTDGGRTWSTVATTGVATAAAGAGNALPQAGAACQAALPDPAHPGSLYATFGLVTPPCNCQPPLYMAGLVTTDDGRTWSVIPQPAVIAPEQGDRGFGGFQLQGNEVVALFASRAGGIAAETTMDGGRTWTTGQPGCPASGPCLRWGPAPSSESPCMTAFPQPVEIHAHGTWSSGAGANLCRGQSQIVALSQTTVALVSGGGAPYPLQVSSDGGRTWASVALPPTPGQAPTGYNGLAMLPDGALLALAQDGWWLLPRGAAAWCAIAAATPPSGQIPKLAADGRLWWLDGVNTGKLPTLHSVALSQLSCP